MDLRRDDQLNLNQMYSLMIDEYGGEGRDTIPRDLIKGGRKKIAIGGVGSHMYEVQGGLIPRPRFPTARAQFRRQLPGGMLVRQGHHDSTTKALQLSTEPTLYQDGN